MPQFPQMTVDDAEAIRAFILDRAWAAYEAQQNAAR
jgi:hypothetical protein